ncbi:DUF4232 domain-containing protein [Streptomyces roseoverticillatus]|uniref:DUF4232 domain-containing protein n=1 Tax=Streptomyces roseoverticillatus TaxID=66429 RepID=UPI001F28019F|nr:DUF4232 domain-containing protein [Streptomyces roseoverticillatus]MCF3103003.1 DUF4232 domain-containing protein [Streptomyces roseoverticillatus]
MRVHKLTFAALAIAAGLSLTACQSDDGGTSQSDPSSGSSASSASSSGGGSGSGGSDQGGGKGSAGKSSGGQGTAAGTGSNKNGKVANCRTDELEITAKDNTIDGDPDGTVAVELKNRGGRSCAISGYAGVDLKTNSGSLSAKRTGEKAPSTILKNGKSTFFGINYPVNKSGGSGVRVTGLLVTPPNETKTVTLPWPGAATLPVTDNPGSPVKVGPIGSAGQGG